MTNFIENLVHKAIGSQAMMLPEPRSSSRFEKSSTSLLSGEGKFHDKSISNLSGGEFQVSSVNLKPVSPKPSSALLTERSDSLIQEDPTGNAVDLRSPGSQPALSASRDTSDPMLKSPVLESSGRSPDKHSTDSDTPLSGVEPSDQNSSLKRVQSETQPGRELKASKRSKDHIDAAIRSDRNISAEPAAILSLSNQMPSIQVIPTVSEPEGDFGSKSSTSESEISETDSLSTLYKSDAQVRQNLGMRTLENDDIQVAVEKKSEVHQQPVHISPADKSVVVIEPSSETDPQAKITRLLTKMNSPAPPQAPTPGVEETRRVSQEKKDVRVTIGRIEVNASQQVSSPPKPPVRGFDDYVMMRMYLDRHYF